MSLSACSRLNRQTLLLGCGLALSVMAHLSAQGSGAAVARANALSLEQQGDNAGAEQAWHDLAESDPDNAEALAHLGLLEARQERLESAIGFYQKALVINPNLPGLRMNYGLALFKAAQFPDAVSVFSAEIEKHPGDQRLTILLGMTHFGMKDYFVAIPYLRKAADHEPQNVTLRMALARACLLSKQYECVIDVHREMGTLNQDTAEAGIIAAEALDALGDHAGAMTQARAALRANPEAANAHFVLGYLLWTEEKWLEACHEFEAELQRNPEDLHTRLYLADAQVRQGEFTRSLPELQRLAAGGASEPLVHLDLGVISARNRHFEEAIRELTTAMQGAIETADVHTRIATELDSLGRSEEARLERERASKISEARNPSLLDVLETTE